MVEKLWYDVCVPHVFITCKVKFEAEDIHSRPVFVQYYEGCLMWIDIASYVEDQKTKRGGREPSNGDLFSQEYFQW